MNNVDMAHLVGTGEFLDQGLKPIRNLAATDHRQIAEMVERELPPVGTAFAGALKKTGYIGNFSLNSPNSVFYIHEKGKEDSEPVEKIETEDKEDTSISLNPDKSYTITDRDHIKATINGNMKEITLNGRKVKILPKTEI